MVSKNGNHKALKNLRGNNGEKRDKVNGVSQSSSKKEKGNVPG